MYKTNAELGDPRGLSYMDALPWDGRGRWPRQGATIELPDGSRWVWVDRFKHWLHQRPTETVTHV